MTPEPLPPDDANVVDPLVLAERRAHRAELAEQAAGRRAADAQALAAELSAERARLEAELEQARREPERLSRLVAERERALRAAEQRAHAEEAQRLEAVDALSERTRRHEADLASLREALARAEADAARERADVEARAAELEAAAARELEARLAQAAAEAARERAELEARVARAEAEAERAEAAIAERLGELQQRVERAEAAATRQGRELEALRGRLAEAEQVAAAAETARKRAEAKRVAARDKRRRAREARDAARAEAEATREGADAVMAEAARAQAERDALRSELEDARAERDALRAEAAQAHAAQDAARAELEQARAERDALRADTEQARAERDAARSAAVVAPTEAPSRQDSGMSESAATEREDATASQQGWSARLRDELSVARAAARRPVAAAGATGAPAPTIGGALDRERRLIAQRAARAQLRPDGAARTAVEAAATAAHAPAPEPRRGPERATPATALALERERSGRLQAQLDRQSATERALREQVAALEQAVQARIEAEARIEGALRRVRGELEAANALRALSTRQAPTRPFARPQSPAQPAAEPVPASEPAGPSTAKPAAEPVPAPEYGGPSAAELAAALDAARAERLAAALAAATSGEQSGEAQEAPAATEAALEAARASDRDPSQPRPTQPATSTADPADGEAPPLAGRAADPAGQVDPLPPPARAHDAAPHAAGAQQLDMSRLSAARERLRESAPPEPPQSARPAELQPSAPQGAPSPWLPDALRRLVRVDPDTAGRILVGMLPAQGLVTQRAFSYDLVIQDRGTVSVDVADGTARVTAAEAPRPQQQLDLKIATTHEGLARLLAGRRGLRRRARIRGRRRRVKELRKLAREPLALRDLASAGAVLEPALAFWLAALAIDPDRTQGHRFTIAHAPLPGGPPDAWLRIQHGGPLAVLRTKPGEAPAVTLRCTRGALLALLAGVAPPPGEGGAIDGDRAALELVRGWIARTEFPNG